MSAPARKSRKKKPKEEIDSPDDYYPQILAKQPRKRKDDPISRIQNEKPPSQVASEQWKEFDELQANVSNLSRVVFIDERTRQKWNHLDLFRQSKAPKLHPLVPRIDLPEKELQLIGDAVINEPFDTEVLPLKRCYGVDDCLFASIERPPDLSQEEYSRLEGLARKSDRVNLLEITLEFLENVLSPCEEEEKMSDVTSARETQELSLRAMPIAHLTSLLWLTTKLAALPLTRNFKEALIANARDIGYSPDCTEKELWHQCMQLYTTIQQDLAAYLWAHGVRWKLEDAEDDSAPESPKAKKRKSKRSTE